MWLARGRCRVGVCPSLTSRSHSGIAPTVYRASPEELEAGFPVVPALIGVGHSDRQRGARFDVLAMSCSVALNKEHAPLRIGAEKCGAYMGGAILLRHTSDEAFGMSGPCFAEHGFPAGNDLIGVPEVDLLGG